jgi:RNA polymerase sigma-70 factor (ECF subfamily)
MTGSRSRPDQSGPILIGYTPDVDQSVGTVHELTRFRRRQGVPSSLVDGEFEPGFAEVLEAAQTGSKRAFEQIFQKLNRRVHGFATARGATDADGVVNDVFLKVFTAIAQFKGNETQFKAWVFRIARNQLIDESRRLARRPVEVHSGLDVPARIVISVVEQDALERLGTAAMVKALDSLTEEQRDVVLLRIVSDLTVETIARVLDKQPGAVKALQRRAFRALAQSMQTAEFAEFKIGAAL